MKFQKSTISFIVLLFSINSIFASTPSAENIGFDLGNFKNWIGSTWISSIYPEYFPSTDIVYGTNTGRHSIISDQNYYDPHTGYLLKAIPPGFQYAAQLGNDMTGCHHQNLIYSLKVDKDKPLLIWRFAVVMQNPIQKHTEDTKPFLSISIKDKYKNPISTCSEYNVISNADLPSFHTYYPPGYDPADSLRNEGISPVLWRDWTSVGIDLSSFAGQDISIEFTSADCKQGGHYCYAYLVAECRPLNLMVDFCLNEKTAILTAPEGFLSYQWLTPDNKTYEGRVLSLANPIENKDYSCTLTSEMGCSATIKSKVYHFNPLIAFEDVQLSCDSNIVQFVNQTTFNTDSLIYKWDFGDSITSNEKSPKHRYSKSGFYNVSLTVGSEKTSCLSTVNKQVEAFSKSNVNVSGSATYCKGFKTTLTASGASHYLWNTGDTTSTIEVGESNIYTVKGFSLDRKCVTEAIVIQVTEEPDWTVSFEGKTMICAGDSNLVTATGSSSYLWDTGAKTPSIYVKEGRTYFLEVTNERGCSKTVSLKTKEYAYPSKNFTSSTNMIDQRHNSVEFKVKEPEDGVNYFWNFNDGSKDEGSNVVHTFNLLGNQPNFNVSLDAINIADCKTTYNTVIHTQPFVPNVFSPNQDGLNDLFMPGYQLKIYDRNGLELFNGNQGWDGTFNFKNVSADTYYYFMEYIDYELKKQSKKGYFVLMR